MSPQEPAYSVSQLPVRVRNAGEKQTHQSIGLFGLRALQGLVHIQLVPLLFRLRCSGACDINAWQKHPSPTYPHSLEMRTYSAL